MCENTCRPSLLSLLSLEREREGVHYSRCLLANLVKCTNPVIRMMAIDASHAIGCQDGSQERGEVIDRLTRLYPIISSSHETRGLTTENYGGYSHAEQILYC